MINESLCFDVKQVGASEIYLNGKKIETIGKIGDPKTRVFKIKNEVAIGVAIGTSSHALGTTKALEMGEIEGAMSSLSIGVAGIMTVFIASTIYQLFINFIV